MRNPTNHADRAFVHCPTCLETVMLRAGGYFDVTQQGKFVPHRHKSGVVGATVIDKPGRDFNYSSQRI